MTGQYPSGGVFRYNSSNGSLSFPEPNVGHEPNASAEAREAQTLAVFGGSVRLGLWPWGTEWKMNPNTGVWSFDHRFFAEPNITGVAAPWIDYVKNPTHQNYWGQRVTGMQVQDGNLYVSTSAKNNQTEQYGQHMIPPAAQEEYGQAYRVSLPNFVSGHFQWPAAGKTTVLEFFFDDDDAGPGAIEMFIKQDGKVIAGQDLETDQQPDTRTSRREGGVAATTCAGLFGICPSGVTIKLSAASTNASQVHLSYDGPGARTLSFVTLPPTTSNAIVRLWEVGHRDDEPRVFAGRAFAFGGSATSNQHTEIVINVVQLSGLAPGTAYVYQCAQDTTLHGPFSTDPPEASPLTLAVFGDLGLNNSVSLPNITDDTRAGAIAGVLHVGDLAYDLDDNGGRTGDLFMEAIEPVASRVDYAVCAGNHENHANFSQYRNRFAAIAGGAGRASGSNSSLYYSFDRGPAHFVFVNTECNSVGALGRQLAWLEGDLAAANRSRAARPWLVVSGHKAWYMLHAGQCPTAVCPLYVRVWALLQAYKTDVYLAGHQHNYQRFLPVSVGPNRTFAVDEAQRAHPGRYTSPRYPTTIVTGSAGCTEGIAHSQGPINATAAAFFSYGYGHLALLNGTHARWQWFQTLTEDGRMGAQLDHDEFWIIKTTAR